MWPERATMTGRCAPTLPDSHGGFFLSASPPSPTTDHRPATIIPEDTVSVAALNEPFKRAFFKTKIDDEGDLYITAGLEFPIWVRVDAERKLITFFTYIQRDLNEHPPFTEALANHLNATVTLPSFYVVASDPDRLYATYHASYEDGIIERHVVGMARYFAGACVYGARTTMTMDEHALH